MKNKLFYVVLASAGLTWLGCKKEGDKPQTIATVTTNAVSGITKTEAVLGGNITSNGNLDIQEKGICYSDTTASPTFYNWKVTAGSGNGAFTSALSNLEPNTTYYVRAYARNSKGVGYGSTVTFSTDPTGPVPVLDPTQVTSGATTPILGGSIITSDGGLPVIERGVCWAIGRFPTIKDARTRKPAMASTFMDTLTGLTYSTHYFVRAYATNANGTGYGEATTVKTIPGLPRLNTEPATNIGDGKATFRGAITYNGGGAITERGFCWSDGPGATINSLGKRAIAGTDYSSFTLDVDDLLNYQTYYYRAYAINSSGVGYGPEQSFSFREPAVTTWPLAIKARPTYLVLKGFALDGYGSKIVERGFVASTDTNPRIGRTGVTKVTSLQDTGIGPFQARMNFTQAGLTYHVRAFARHQYGIGYGQDVVISTPPAYTIGQAMEGGKIFFVFADKSRGLIASDEDLPINPADSTWGCQGANIFTLDSIGSGRTNTNTIVSTCGEPGTAARICASYDHNGFSDWFLPSRLEAKELYTRRNQVGLTFGYYWCSTQADADNAYLLKLADGTFVPELKNTGSTPKRVRAIRYFE